MSDAKCVIYVKNAIFDIYVNLKRSIISRKQYLPNKLCMKKSCFASLKTRLSPPLHFFLKFEFYFFGDVYLSSF